MISIKGYQCDSSASSENHVSTYKSVFKILPHGGEENVENVTPTSSLPMVNKFTHPVILSPYRYVTERCPKNYHNFYLFEWDFSLAFKIKSSR